ATFLLDIDTCSGRQELAALLGELQAIWESSNWHRVFCLCVLAERYYEIGHFEDGLAVLASIPANDREAIYAPEIVRLEGELRRRLMPWDFDQVENCFKTAVALAARRSEKSLQLRAAMSLARLWRDCGRCPEARAVLQPTLDWFTEGFDL